MYQIVIVIIITLAYVLVAMWRSSLILLNYLKVRTELKNSLEWPGVTGQITSSNIEETVSYSRARGDSHIYHPEINYLYTVNDKEYDGNRVRFGSNSGTSKKQEAYALTKRYPQNALVKIYYDPRGPANSVIERELADYYKAAITRETVKFMVCIMIFILAGIYFAAM